MNAPQPPSTPVGERPVRSPIIVMLLALATLYVAITIVKWGFVHPAITYGVDFKKHWLAAHQLFNGGSVYRGHELAYGFNYPQLVALVFFWLKYFSVETAERLWEIFHFGLIVGCWAIAWKGLAPPHRVPPPADPLRRGVTAHWGLTAAVLMAAYHPIVECLTVCNIDPYNAILILGMTAALLTGRERLGGVLWMLVVLCKLVPVAAIVPLLLWRRWRALGAAAATVAAYLAVLAMLGRLGEEGYLYTKILPEISFYWRDISHGLQRWLLLVMDRDDWYNDPQAFGLFTLASQGSVAGLYCVLAVIMRRRGMTLIRVLEPTFLLLPLITPMLEYHHFVYSLPVIYLHLRRWLAGEMNNGLLVGYAIGWIGLVHAKIFLDLWPSNPLIWDFLPLWFAMLLFGLSALEALLPAKTAAPDANEPVHAG